MSMRADQAGRGAKNEASISLFRSHLEWIRSMMVATQAVLKRNPALEAPPILIRVIGCQRHSAAPCLCPSLVRSRI